MVLPQKHRVCWFSRSFVLFNMVVAVAAVDDDYMFQRHFLTDDDADGYFLFSLRCSRMTIIIAITGD